jgi:hypothetical protein
MSTLKANVEPGRRVDESESNAIVRKVPPTDNDGWIDAKKRKMAHMNVVPDPVVVSIEKTQAIEQALEEDFIPIENEETQDPDDDDVIVIDETQAPEV